MSWSSNRKSEPTKSKEEILQNLKHVNAVLEQLAFDSDLTDDFKDPQVARAIKHWTNEHRLPHEEALQFQDNYRVVSVLKKIKLLQDCCRLADITLPLQLLLSRKPQMGTDFLCKTYGKELGTVIHAELSKQHETKTEGKSSESSKSNIDKSNGTNIKKEYPLSQSNIVESKKNPKSPHHVNDDVSDPQVMNRMKKVVYGPKSASDAHTEDVNDMLDTVFWSTSRPLTDPQFSTKEFIMFSVGEIFFIIMSGLLLALAVKSLM